MTLSSQVDKLWRPFNQRKTDLVLISLSS